MKGFYFTTDCVQYIYDLCLVRTSENETGV